MEELFRYALFKLAKAILYLELISIAGCLIIIVLIKIHAGWRRRKDGEIQRKLSELISDALAAKNFTVSVPPLLSRFKNLLATLESFDRKFTDEDWVKIKKHIFQTRLLKRARRYLKRRSWVRRQRAARCFLLCPEAAAKKEIYRLVHDRKFLIRIIAASIVVKTSYQDLFYEVVRVMSKENAQSRFPYRDVLLHADAEKFQWLEKLLQTDLNPAVSAVCLDLLSTRTTKNLFSVIVPFIYGKDRQCRFLAVKILRSMPSEEAADILYHCLDDEDWEIRAESLKALDPALAKKFLPAIEERLNDSVWSVRLQAALLLKKLGGEGVQALSSINPHKKAEAYEIARYVLANPSF